MARIPKLLTPTLCIPEAAAGTGPSYSGVLSGSILKFSRQDPLEKTQHGFSGPPEVQHHLKLQRSVHGVTYDSSIGEGGATEDLQKAGSDGREKEKKFSGAL